MYVLPCLLHELAAGIACCALAVFTLFATCCLTVQRLLAVTLIPSMCLKIFTVLVGVCLALQERLHAMLLLRKTASLHCHPNQQVMLLAC